MTERGKNGSLNNGTVTNRYFLLKLYYLCAVKTYKDDELGVREIRSSRAVLIVELSCKPNKCSRHVLLTKRFKLHKILSDQQRGKPVDKTIAKFKLPLHGTWKLPLYSSF